MLVTKLDTTDKILHPCYNISHYDFTLVFIYLPWCKYGIYLCYLVFMSKLYFVCSLYANDVSIITYMIKRRSVLLEIFHKTKLKPSCVDGNNSIKHQKRFEKIFDRRIKDVFDMMFGINMRNVLFGRIVKSLLKSVKGLPE